MAKSQNKLSPHEASQTAKTKVSKGGVEGEGDEDGAGVDDGNVDDDGDSHQNKRHTLLARHLTHQQQQQQ